MDTIFMNSENRNANPFRRILKTIVLSILSIYDTWTNIKKSYKNNKFKTSALTQKDKLKLPQGSYSERL